MSKGLKRVIIISILGLMVIGLLFGGRLLVNRVRYRRIISEIEIRTPNLTEIQDGTSTGYFDAILVSANVDVTVEEHRITEIVINSHHHGRDRALDAEEIIVDVIENQSLEVDTVSGATNSSLVILKAIQIALDNGAE